MDYFRNDSRVCYLDIYGFATDSVEIRYIQPEIIVKVKLKPRVYSVQHQIPAKFHPDGSTFEEMATQKPIFGSQSRMLEYSFPRLLVPWNFRSRDRSFPGPFVPETEYYAEIHSLDYNRSNTSFIVYVK